MYNKSMLEMIDNIVEVVFNMYFNYIKDPDLRQDLMQEGYVKAYELLYSGNYDPSRNLRTYIFTGVRNAMSNYRYHNNKESHLSTSTTIEDNAWMYTYNNIDNDIPEERLFYNDDEQSVNYEVDLDLVKSICNKYKMFGDYYQTVLIDLKELGIYFGKVSKNNTLKEIALVKEAIKGEILWKMLET